MTCDRQRGFSLVEMIIVLAVAGILVGTAMPLANAVVDADRREKVRRNLEDIARAAEEYYFDTASFPTSLSMTGFFGTYLQRGIDDDTIRDAWGGAVEYRMSTNTAANTISIWSRGENGTDEGLLNEDFSITVSGAAPGMRKTRLRIRIIVEALGAFLESGGTLTGTWSTDRAALGLGSEFQTDGFGTAFTLDASTLVLASAGPDRITGNGDDLTN